MASRAGGVLLARSLRDHVVIRPVQITVGITKIEPAMGIQGYARSSTQPELTQTCAQEVHRDVVAVVRKRMTPNHDLRLTRAQCRVLQ